MDHGSRAVDPGRPAPDGPATTTTSGEPQAAAGGLGLSGDRRNEVQKGAGWSSLMAGNGSDGLPQVPEGVVVAALYVDHEPRSTPRGWHGAFAGRPTNTVLLGALLVVGVALLVLLFVLRSGTDPTGSARIRSRVETALTVVATPPAQGAEECA